MFEKKHTRVTRAEYHRSTEYSLDARPKNPQVSLPVKNECTRSASCHSSKTTPSTSLRSVVRDRIFRDSNQSSHHSRCFTHTSNFVLPSQLQACFAEGSPYSKEGTDAEYFAIPIYSMIALERLEQYQNELRDILGSILDSRSKLQMQRHQLQEERLKMSQEISIALDTLEYYALSPNSGTSEKLDAIFKHLQRSRMKVYEQEKIVIEAEELYREKERQKFCLESKLVELLGALPAIDDQQEHYLLPRHFLSTPAPMSPIFQFQINIPLAMAVTRSAIPPPIPPSADHDEVGGRFFPCLRGGPNHCYTIKIASRIPFNRASELMNMRLDLSDTDGFLIHNKSVLPSPESKLFEAEVRRRNGHLSLEIWKSGSGRSKSWKRCPRIIIRRSLQHHLPWKIRNGPDNSFHLAPPWIPAGFLRHNNSFKAVRYSRLVTCPHKSRKGTLSNDHDDACSRRDEVSSLGHQTQPHMISRRKSAGCTPSTMTAYHIHCGEEPAPSFIRLTLGTGSITGIKCHVERFLTEGHVLQGLFQVVGFVRDDSHADVYSVRGVRPSLGQMIDPVFEAHVFHNTLYRNTANSAKRRKQRMLRSGFCVDTFWIHGQHVLIMNVRENSFSAVREEIVELKQHVETSKRLSHVGESRTLTYAAVLKGGKDLEDIVGPTENMESRAQSRRAEKQRNRRRETRHKRRILLQDQPAIHTTLIDTAK